MNDLQVTVFAGSDRTAFVDVGIPAGMVKAESLQAHQFTLAFTDAAEPPRRHRLGLRGWELCQLTTTEADGPHRVVLIAPANFPYTLQPGTEATLTLKLSERSKAVGSCTVIGDQPSPTYERLVDEARRARDAVSLYAAYPILTSPGPDGAAGGGAGAPAGGGDARAVVQREWRNVLGRVPRDGDVAGMLAALDRRFVATEADGVEGWTFTPGSYVGQNDVGAGVTGAQASLAAFAQRASQEIEPYVTQATPLRQLDDNPEAVEVARSGFTASWRSFVGSLGDEGGLPAARAKVLLAQAHEQLVSFGVELGMLDDGAVELFRTQIADADVTETDVVARLPVTRAFVLTREDEERLTGFMIVRDRVAAVGRAFWDAIGEERSALDYGMAFTWLQRDLDVLPELVRDVRWALDSVDFGLEQQEVTALQQGDPNSMTLASVFQWAEDLSDEGRTLLQDSGVRGAGMLAERAEALGQTLALIYGKDGPQLGGGVFAARLAMSRIRVPIGLLANAVERVRRQAGDVAADATRAAQKAPAS